MDKILNAITKEQSDIQNLKIDNILKNGIVYLSDNKNSYAARLTSTGRYKKNSFHLIRNFTEICYG